MSSYRRRLRFPAKQREAASQAPWPLVLRFDGDTVLFQASAGRVPRHGDTGVGAGEEKGKIETWGIPPDYHTAGESHFEKNSVFTSGTGR